MLTLLSNSGVPGWPGDAAQAMAVQSEICQGL